MKGLLLVLVLSFQFISCVKEDVEGTDTFSVEEINIALIYQDSISEVPCHLHSVTDVLKKDKNIGIILRSEVSFNDPPP